MTAAEQFATSSSMEFGERNGTEIFVLLGVVVVLYYHILGGEY